MTMTVQPETRRNGKSAVRPQRVDPRSEQASGLPWYSGYLGQVRALPPSIDDATRQFGDDLYERMLYDPQVKGDTEVLKGGILASQLSLTPPIPEPKDGDPPAVHADYEQAKQVRDFCQRNLDDLQESLNDVLYDLLDCAMYGNRVAEIVYRDGLPGEGAEFGLASALFLRALKPKPRHSLAFVVDAFANVIGLLARIPGQYTAGIYGNWLLEGNVPNLMPREKFLVFTWRPKDGDPRGTSLGRAVYSAWWNKLQVLGEYLRYLTQFAGPSLVALLDPAISAAAVGLPKVDAAGNLILDADGNPTIVNPAQENFDLLEQLRNGTVAVLQWVKELIPIQMQGEGAAFLNSFEYWNREISKGLLGNTLSTNEGQHQARAAAQQAQDVTGVGVAYGRKLVEEALHDDVLSWLVEYNYGPEARRLTPLVSLADSEQQDKAAMIGALARVGFTTHWSQAEKIDAEVGLPPRMPGWRDDEIANRPVVPAPGADPNAAPPDEPPVPGGAP